MFDVEPLPLDHPFRKLDNVVITPHLGYVSERNYRMLYRGIVEDIRAWLDGKPVRVIRGEIREVLSSRASAKRDDPGPR